MSPAEALGGSFRDPRGFVFRRAGELFRQVNHAHREDYDRLMQSGLYEALTSRGLLVAHRETQDEASGDAYRILAPETIPFVSYPYEWSFSQLRDAALLTLELQRLALGQGMTLRDASAYNVQFRAGQPVFIDTLSFGVHREGSPWVAYRQFCEHFLAPLALMARVDVRLGRLLQIFLDGVPLDLASRLLPRRTWLRFGLLTHLHLHAKAQSRWSERSTGAARAREARVGSRGMLGLIESLRSAVAGLQWEAAGSEWADYYDDTNYEEVAARAKQELVAELVAEIRPGTVWDLGANTGRFSRVAAASGAYVVSWDLDPAAVERNYAEVREVGDGNLLPLVLDLSNPSPALGWAHAERMSFAERGPADLVLALALIHHLAIGGNVPLDRIAAFLASIAREVLIEFVPKQDSQVQRLLASRDDVFPHYEQASFEQAFKTHFELLDVRAIPQSCRTLYRLARHAAASPTP